VVRVGGNRLGWVFVAGLLAVLVGAAEASAAIDARGTRIDATASHAPGTNRIEVRGQVTCSDCVRFTLGLTITQRGTGALAQGGVRCRCEGPTTRWVLRARILDGTPFELGRARVCAWVVTRSASGAATDAHQFCRAVTIATPT
jgi:hypothetical protein